MQTKHYLAADASPVEEVMLSTLPSGATEVSIFAAKGANHPALGELREGLRALGHDVVVDVHPERGVFLKATVAGEKPEDTLNVLIERGLFPASPQEKLQGEKEDPGKFQKFRETALKYATRSAVLSHLIFIVNGWITRDPDKVAAGVTFASTNSLAALRGTGKRGGEVDALFSKAYKTLELDKAGLKPVDTLNFKEQAENSSGIRKGINKAIDFAWNKHPYEIGEVAATAMNAQMTFKKNGKQKDTWWLLNTFTSFLAGGTLGFVPPKPHVAEGKEDKYPSGLKQKWSFIQTHSTKIGGFVNIMSNIFAVMSGVKAVQNYKNFKEHGEQGLVTTKKNGEVVDLRLPANEGRKGLLPKVPMNEKQRYFATAVTAMSLSVIWLGVGLMTFLGDKNKKRDQTDDQMMNDLAAKSAEVVLQAESASQPEIAKKLAEYFGARKDVKGKPEELYNVIVQKVQAMRSSPFLEAGFHQQTPDAATPAQAAPQPEKTVSVAERVGVTKRGGQWADQPEIDPATRKESSQMSVV